MQKMKTGMAFRDEFISGEKDKNFVKNQSFKILPQIESEETGS